jgi:hypothetical protein
VSLRSVNRETAIRYVVLRRRQPAIFHREIHSMAWINFLRKRSSAVMPIVSRFQSCRLDDFLVKEGLSTLQLPPSIFQDWVAKKPHENASPQQYRSSRPSPLEILVASRLPRLHARLYFGGAIEVRTQNVVRQPCHVDHEMADSCKSPYSDSSSCATACSLSLKNPNNSLRNREWPTIQFPLLCRQSDSAS